MKDDDGFKNLISDDDAEIRELIEDAYTRGFADDFVASVEKQFKERGTLTEKQIQGLRNIVEAPERDDDYDSDGDPMDYYD